MPEKRTFRFGFPAEDGYGYAQAVETGGTLHISGQVAFDADCAREIMPLPAASDRARIKGTSFRRCFIRTVLPFNVLFRCKLEAAGPNAAPAKPGYGGQ